MGGQYDTGMIPRDQDWRRPATARLRDVLEFLRVNPGQLSEVQRRTWLERLRPLEGVPSGAWAASWPMIHADDPVEVADLLRHVHAEVSNGLRALLRLGEPWQLPAGHSELVGHVIQPRPIRRRFQFEAHMPTEGATLIRAVAGLVAVAGESLRECARCQTVFLGRKRGVYCGRACQQAEMAARKTIRRRRERRKPRGPLPRRQRQKKGA